MRATSFSLCSIVILIVAGAAVRGLSVASAKRPLAERSLVMPVAGMKLSDLRNTFAEGRGSERRHEATDIVAPRGTPVLAVEDGTVRKLFLSKPGGLTIYQFDPEERYCYYYAQLERYAPDLKKGPRVGKGR